MNTQLHSRLTGSVHRIVVKVGSGVLTRKNSLNTDIIASLSGQICWLYDRGIQVILGMGLVNYNATDVLKIMGCQTSQIKDRLGYRPYDEVIHRDNLVITADPV